MIYILDSDLVKLFNTYLKMKRRDVGGGGYKCVVIVFTVTKLRPGLK